MADSKIQRRTQWGVNVLILLVTLLLFILAFFIPGLQIVAVGIGLSAALAPAVMAGTGVIAAVIWNAPFVLSWLMTRHESNKAEDENANQAGTSPTPSSHSTLLSILNFFSSMFGASNANKGTIEELALHVVRGEYDQAKAMIEKNPALLLEKCQVEDYSGRKIEGTPLQIALWANDVRYP